MSDDDLFDLLDRLRQTRNLLAKDDGDVSDDALDGEMIPMLLRLAKTISRLSPDEDLAFSRAMASIGRFADLLVPIFGAPSRPPATAEKPDDPWPYPVVHRPKHPSKGAFDGEGDFREFSALKMFGYTVGKKGRNKGWTDRKRRQFLSDFMEMRLPAIVKKTFGDEYGEPMSTTRLRKVANVIASNATNFARRGDPAFDQAITDWEADLGFLEEKYYHGKGLKFEPWPEVER